MPPSLELAAPPELVGRRVAPADGWTPACLMPLGLTPEMSRLVELAAPPELVGRRVAPAAPALFL
jgi:hypothetical protein